MRTCLLLLLAGTLSGQTFDFHGRDALPELAKEVLASYHGDERFRVQLVAGDYAGAISSLEQLRAKEHATQPAFADWMNVQYEIYARAKASAAPNFDEAYKSEFRKVLQRMDDRAAGLLLRAMAASPDSFENNVKNDLERLKGAKTISLADAVDLLHDEQVAEAYRAAAPLVRPLIDEDDARRYVIQRDLRVKTPDGATLCTLVLRPRKAPARTATLLEFTIYAEPRSNFERARLGASHGYSSVVGLTRGKGCSPDRPVPYEHDGNDAAALIDWIAAQPWSDGRVGMYGGSYSGFTAWAAAKHMPKALKTIVVGAPAAPAIDVPMEGNVVWNFIYPWPLYTTDNKLLDDALYGDSIRWDRLNHDWYMSGRPYRDLDKIDRTPNPIFDKWISHPAYDAYWQAMIPYKKEFARIKIPILQTAGYYFGGPGAAVYYLNEHQKYDPRADEYLLIGPYHHFGAQVGTFGLLGQAFPSLAGLRLDPVAMVDLEALRYEWFDFIFKNAPKPALLKDHVNYEVTGANEWKHAPSIAAMSSKSMRLYLTPEHLSEHKADSFATLKVDLKDRSDAARPSIGGGVLDTAIETRNGLEFVSDPLPRETEMSGLFSGSLDVSTNKRDFDFEIDLYERTPKGEYVQLAPYWSRASFVGDLGHRHLLTPGRRHRIRFEAGRLMSRRLAAGSRVVAVVSLIKQPDREINYGSGKNVIDESVADAGAPLEIRWYGDSYIDLPLGN